jgi:hypothetical protein
MILNISTALYLFASGVLGFSGGGEIRQAVNVIFSGNVANICTLILSVCAIAAGIFILLRFFGIDIAITELLLGILMILWIVFIILIDIVPIFGGGFNFVGFLTRIAPHLMVLGSMALATERFGGF